MAKKINDADFESRKLHLIFNELAELNILRIKTLKNYSDPQLTRKQAKNLTRRAEKLIELASWFTGAN